MSNEQQCPQCRGPMTEREGKYGKFFGCNAYPNCKGIIKIQQQAGTSYTPPVNKQERIEEAMKNKKDSIAWMNAKNNATMLLCHGKITSDELREKMEWFYAQDAPDDVEKIESKFDPKDGFAQGGTSTNPIDNITFN